MNILNKNKSILVYGLNNSELAELIKRKINYILIKEDMGAMKIFEIAGGLKFSNSNVKLPKEKAILFNNYSDKELQKSVQEIRTFIKGGVLAVITETSKNWTFEYLVNHLIEEREWYKSNQKG